MKLLTLQSFPIPYTLFKIKYTFLYNTIIIYKYSKIMPMH